MCGGGGGERGGFHWSGLRIGGFGAAPGFLVSLLPRLSLPARIRERGLSMQLGASIPVSDIGTGPAVLRDYAQAAEELGYAHLVAPAHVLGVNPDADHDLRPVGPT